MIRYDHPQPYPKSPLGPNTRWSHLWSETNNVEELHEFATRIGLKRSWFQDKPNFPHYDIAGKGIGKAMMAGAIFSSLQDWIERYRYKEDLKEFCESFYRDTG